METKMGWIAAALALAVLLPASLATAANLPLEVVHLTDNSFAETVKDGNAGPWFVNFYTNWCPWSQRLAPEWEQLGADEAVRFAGVMVAAVDCEHNRITCKKANIQGYPTMKLFSNGAVVENYYGDRDLHSLKAYVLAHGHVSNVGTLPPAAPLEEVDAAFEVNDAPMMVAQNAIEFDVEEVVQAPPFSVDSLVDLVAGFLGF